MQQDQVSGEDEGLELGYSGEMPEANPAAAEPELTPEPEAKQPEAKPDTHPADTESEALRLAKTLDGRFRNITGEINKFASRLDELASKLSPEAVAAATAAVKQEGSDAPTNQQINAAMKDGAKMSALRDEFPDWADAISEAVADGSSEIEARILQKMSKAEKVDTSGFATSDAVTELKHLFIEQKHPDWIEKVAAPEFSQWLDAQPDDVRKLGESNNPKDAIALIDKYEARTTFKATNKPDPKNRLTAAVLPRTGANRPPASVMTEDDALTLGYQNAV